MLNKFKRKKENNNNKMINKNIYNKIPKHLKHLSIEKLKALLYLFRGNM
jgi:hypothetical protein